MTVKRQFGVILINHNSDINTVTDLERGIVAIPHSFKECRRHKSYAALCPSENLKSSTVICNSKTMAAIVSRAPIFGNRGLVGAPFHNFRSITVNIHLVSS